MSLRPRAGCLVLVAVLVWSAAHPISFAAARADPFQMVERSDDVAWLERIASSLAEAGALQPPGGLARHAKDIRTAAYARLGALGTDESLAAARRVEQTARNQPITPDTVSIGVWTHPCWHFSDNDVRPLAQTEAPDGTTYALVCSAMLGDLDLFLISSRTPEDEESWSRPRLMPGETYRSIREPALTAKSNEVLIFSYIQEKPGPRNIMEGTVEPGQEAPLLGEQRREVVLEDLLRDQDADGWTDMEELRLGLDPREADTDGDGIIDGMDACPNFTRPEDHESDEDVEILQKAIFATFGLTDSRYLLIVGPESAKVHVFGYRGPVIYMDDVEQWREEHGYGAVFVKWRVERDGNEAKVLISDYEAPLAAGSQYVFLNKIAGKWIVVRRELGPVS